MDPATLAGLMVLLMLLLLALEVPIAWSLAIAGALGIALLRDPTDALSLLRDGPMYDVSAYALVVIPMYILLGNFALHGRLASQVFTVAAKLSGKRPAALGVATILACGAFSAVCGSSVATAATMAKLAIPQMVRFGYPAHLAAGIVAAGGTLGILIPPSILLVVYGILTEVSITQLLAAGILPGILTIIAYSTYVIVRIAPIMRDLAPVPALSATGGGSVAVVTGAGPGQTRARNERNVSDANARSTAGSFSVNLDEKTPWRGVVRAGIIFLLVFAGIYFGFMTVTESAALAALAALLFLVLELRKEGTRTIGRAMRDSMMDAAATTSMVFSILIGSSIFAYFIVLTGLPREFAKWVGTLDVPPIAVIVVLLLILIPLGMALDELAIIVLAVPFMYPIVDELGFSLIWFGILVIKMMEIGLVAPPVGMNVFVVAGVARKYVTTEQTYRGILGFIVVDLIVVVILIVFPDIVMVLPNLIAAG